MEMFESVRSCGGGFLSVVLRCPMILMVPCVAIEILGLIGAGLVQMGMALAASLKVRVCLSCSHKFFEFPYI